MSGGTCTVCRHPKRKAIEADIVRGCTLRDMAVRFGVAKTIIARHATEHMETGLIKAQERRELAHGEAIAREFDRLYARNGELSQKAEENEDYRGASAATGEQRRLLEFVAKRVDDQKNRADPLSFPEVVEFVKQLALIVRDCPSCAAKLSALGGLPRGDSSDPT